MVRHAGEGPTLLAPYGEAAGTAEAEARHMVQCEAAAALLRRAGFETSTLRGAAELETAIWRKLAVNAAINPVRITPACSVPVRITH